MSSPPIPSGQTIPIRSAFQTGITVSAPPGEWNIDGMMFDAWLRLNHNTGLTITQHPVEVGASISDHSFGNQRRFSFDIGMSDVITATTFLGSVKKFGSDTAASLQSLVSGSIFSQTPSRSINAYSALVQMQMERRLLTLTSKYGYYEDILIESMDVMDDFQTQAAMKATVNLVQVIIADTRVFKVSQNPHATDPSNRGKVSPVPALGTWERVVFDWNQLFQ